MHILQTYISKHVIEAYIIFLFKMWPLSGQYTFRIVLEAHLWLLILRLFLAKMRLKQVGLVRKCNQGLTFCFRCSLYIELVYNNNNKIRGSLPSTLLEVFSTTEFEIQFSKHFNVYWKLTLFNSFCLSARTGERSKQCRYDPCCHLSL